MGVVSAQITYDMAMEAVSRYSLAWGYTGTAGPQLHALLPWQASSSTKAAKNTQLQIPPHPPRVLISLTPCLFTALEVNSSKRILTKLLLPMD